ncbi:MAG: DUF2252 family protein [Cyanobacteria bacterium REEB67]|nr:DUF2252 family protein [Cyanobacteria bacterium REEB67]
MSPRDDRRARGQIMHEAIPHRSHAVWKPADNRPDPVDLLLKSGEGRMQELLPLRYGRMLVSPFTFYRGTAGLMAFDLANTPNSTVRVQTCGDAHLMNFGAFATPERNIVFDLNDFDETLPAPWEWDLKRLAVSFVLAARDNDLKDKHARNAALAIAKSYRKKTLEYSRKSILDIWYDRIDWSVVQESTSDKELKKHRRERTEKALKRTIASYYFPKMTEAVDGKHTIKDNPPTIYHMAGAEGDKFRDHAARALPMYRETLQEDRRRLFDRYKLEDIAIKVVGIGSVGTVCAVALMLAPDDEPMFLQFKQATNSVLEAYAGRSEFENHGQRVVAGQRIIQSASDIFLGWTQFEDGKHFYIRQLRDGKVKLEPELWDGDRMAEAAELMGAALARAHARSGDSTVISGYMGEESTFDEAIADFAMAYADQALDDYERFAAAAKLGKFKVADDLGLD